MRTTTVGADIYVSRKRELALQKTHCSNDRRERFNVQTETRKVQHPVFSRRSTIQAGALGLLGLGMNHLRQLQAASPAESAPAKRVVYVFLTGGLSQHDSFDMKPLAPDNVRGEFQPISHVRERAVLKPV